MRKERPSRVSLWSSMIATPMTSVFDWSTATDIPTSKARWDASHLHEHTGGLSQSCHRRSKIDVAHALLGWQETKHSVISNCAFDGTVVCWNHETTEDI